MRIDLHAHVIPPARDDFPSPLAQGAGPGWRRRTSAIAEGNAIRFLGLG